MKEDLLIGTYSKNGIYECSFNGEKLNVVNLENLYENCSYLCKNNNAIYGVTEYSDNLDFENGILISTDKNLSIKNTASIFGKGPCHITLDSIRNLLYVSNYGDGSLNVFSLNDNGKINGLIYKKVFTPHSRIHCTAISSDYRFLFVIDLGSNTLFAYKIISNESEFDLKEVSKYTFTNEVYPRHISVTKDDIYVITEKSCELYHFNFNSLYVLELINFVSLLPDNTDLQDNFTGCAIKISNDFKFIYTTIRGHNSISVFTPSLKLIQNVSCFGITPRDINFNSLQDFMFCANQDSSDISIFKRNKKTGHLLFKNKCLIDNPACVILL